MFFLSFFGVVGFLTGNRNGALMAGVDETDRAILSALRENSRQPYVDLAKTVGVSERTIRTRVRRLEEDGVIRSYTIREKGIGRNTLGWLRAGKAPTKFFLVIGAHVDHVGKGQRGSRAKKKDEGKIHPGADDNASGISILLEIAQLLSDLKKRGLLKMNFDLLIHT